jgi:putative transcriptional regulator
MAMIRQPENFPETVKEVRRQLALSQEELAHILGVSFATAYGGVKSLLLTF